MGRLAMICMIMVLCGCGFSEYQAKISERERKAIETVKTAESKAGGSTISALALVLSVAEGAGHKIELVGWGATTALKSDDVNVWFKVRDNDKDEEFRWLVDGQGNIYPQNDLASKITSSP